MKILGLVLTVVLIALLSPALLGAQEFSFDEPSARAAALGGAFTARADDATALFCNPAGLAFLGAFRIKTNAMLCKRGTSASWTDGGALFKSEPSEFLGNIALSWQPVKRATFGVGLFSPFNYESAWTPGGDGLSIGGRSLLRTMAIRTAVAVEPIEGLAFGVGLDIVSSTARWQPAGVFGTDDTVVNNFEVSNYGLHGHGMSFVAGALWKIVPAVQVGAKYQERLPIDCRATNVGNEAATGKLTLPRQITGGVALTPVNPLSVYLDIEWARWSEFESLLSTYSEGVELALRNTTAIKTGVEYRLGQYAAVRAGYARHQSSVDEAGRTPVYPDLDRNVYSLGFGYEGPLYSIRHNGQQVSDLSFDVFIRYATGGPAAAASPAPELTYNSSRLQFGFGVGFVF
jgi:long-chain fatty acid transport protein